MIVSLWGDSGQRRLEGAVLIKKIVVVHDGFLEDVDGHGRVHNGCHCVWIFGVCTWCSDWNIICKLFTLILAFGVFDRNEIFARELRFDNVTNPLIACWSSSGVSLIV